MDETMANMQVSLKKNIGDIYQDGLSDLFIDQCRNRITKKEENEKFNHQ